MIFRAILPFPGCPPQPSLGNNPEGIVQHSRFGSVRCLTIGTKEGALMRKSLVLAPTAGAFAILSRTASLLAISLTILSAQGRAQTQMVLVTTGSTMPEPLYVLWGDEYHKLHAETQLRYLPVGTSESAKNILSGTGDLGGGDAPIPEKQLKAPAHAAVELPTILVGIAVFYNVPGR